MKIKKTLRNLRDYIAATRQVGHTTAMIRGAQNIDSVIVLAHTQHHASLLQKQLPNATVKAITNPSAVIGMNKPLVVDNATLWEICGGALAEIERLEHRIEELSKANASVMDGPNHQPIPNWKMSDQTTSESPPIEARIGHRILIYAAQRKPHGMNQHTIEAIVREEMARGQNARGLAPGSAVPDSESINELCH